MQERRPRATRAVFALAALAVPAAAIAAPDTEGTGDSVDAEPQDLLPLRVPRH